ncbi:MAG: DUF4112 domain-containing protein [Prevotella sp.]|nr:DUF4112 domain-containing protein [Prevotella sp.]
MNRQRAAEKLRSSKLYALLRRTTEYMDRYYLDAAVGFAIPGGIGDAISGVFSLLYVYFAAFVVRSVPLALAVLNNIMRDVIMGMIPFYVGDVIDIFHKSNKKNMALIDGFVDGDEQIVSTVKRKAAWSAAIFVLLCILLYAMIRLVIWAGQQVISLF